MKQNSVENRIVEVANTKISGKYNLAQYKKEKARLMAHKSVCEAVLAFKQENKYMPMYAILSCGISAGAFKNEEFDKGYKSFDKEKAQTIFDMAVAYNKANGIDGAPNDVTYRVCTKFYKKVSHNVSDFESALAKLKKPLTDERKDFHKICKAVGC